MSRKKKKSTHNRSLISDYTIASFIMHMIAEEEKESLEDDSDEWRFGVPDGSKYDVDPWLFDTEAEYYEALLQAISNAWKQELTDEEAQTVIAYNLELNDYTSYDAFRRAVNLALSWRDNIDAEIRERGELCGIEPTDYVLEKDYLDDVDLYYDWQDYIDYEIEEKARELGLDINLFSSEEELIDVIEKTESDIEQLQFASVADEKETFDESIDYPLYSDGYYYFYDIYKKDIDAIDNKVYKYFSKTPISISNLSKGIEEIKKIFYSLPVCLRYLSMDEQLVCPLKVSSSTVHEWIAFDDEKINLINQYCDDLAIPTHFSDEYEKYKTWVSEELTFRAFLQKNALKPNANLEWNDEFSVMEQYGLKAYFNNQYNSFFYKILLAHHNTTDSKEKELCKTALKPFIDKLFESKLDYFLKLEKVDSNIFDYISEVDKLGPKFIKAKDRLFEKRHNKGANRKSISV